MKTTNTLDFAKGLQPLSQVDQLITYGGEMNFFTDLGKAVGAFLGKLWATPQGSGCNSCIPMML